MTIMTNIFLMGIVLGVTAVSVIYLRKLRELRGLMEFGQKQIDELMDALAKSKEITATGTQRAADQSRRIAWLESRIRRPKPANDEVLDDTVLTETPKQNMTERRHRVIALASRGQGIDAIAATLGLMPGEVELIVNLNRAAVSNRII